MSSDPFFLQRLNDESRKIARPVDQRVRSLAAEHLRRDNERHGRTVWEDAEIGEVLSGKRDHAPICQAIADALEIVGA